MGEKDLNIEKFKKLILKENRISCDSMIFSYHFHAHPSYKKFTLVLFQLLKEGEIVLTTSVVSLLEMLSFKDLEENLQDQELIREFFLTQKNLKLYPLNVELAEYAAKLRRSTTLKAFDSVQIATAYNSDTKVFLTNDKDFKNITIQGLKIVYLDQFT